jgi:hypothetical protein
VEHVDSMLVEGVVWPKQGHHVQQSELVLVEQSWGWQGAREKVYGWGWGVRMKALESLEGGTAVKGEKFQFTGCEAESGQTTEQPRCRIAGLNPQAGSRITPVVSCHPTGDDTVERLGVASHTTGDTWEVA